MFGLIYKELVLQKRNLLLLGGAFALLLAILFFPAVSGYLNTLSETMGLPADTLLMLWQLVIFIILFLITGVYQSTIFEVDENKKWAGFITASPLRGNGQIAAKYWFTLLLSLAAFEICQFFYMISGAVYGISVASVPFLPIFYLQLLLRAFEYPFLVRFGSKNGGNYKGILFLIVVMLVIIYLLFGDLSAFGSLNDMTDWLFQCLMMENAISSDGLMIAQAALPYASALLYYLSYRVSCKFYQMGVETYDK
ncbi:MAG: ABC-2 transporter permease [Bacteroides sp.]|nr:ABC-2 transporter permease [Bacteroides sp.]MCM1548687.1 ABC-2 transporter permease [Clostridium sp.]